MSGGDDKAKALAALAGLGTSQPQRFHGSEPTTLRPELPAKKQTSKETKTEEADPMIKFGTYIPKSLKKKLDIHSATEEMDIQDIVTAALERYLSN